MKRDNSRQSLQPIQQRLRQELLACKYERNELARMASVSVKTISAYLHKNVLPAPDTFAKLCIALEVSADFILNGEGKFPDGAELSAVSMQTIHENLSEAIATSGKPHKELAEEIGVSNRTISAYLHNGIFPALDTLAKLCRVLDVSADSVLGISRI